MKVIDAVILWTMQNKLELSAEKRIMTVCPRGRIILREDVGR